ncbi:MAG: hypothetical protein IIV05_01540 [Ruminococcus sp.]|nr:hypothetical protein [Ruminococcus sp.]
MSEILTQAGSAMRIVQNADGTVTASVGKLCRVFDTFDEAVVWCCAVRDGVVHG